LSIQAIWRFSLCLGLRNHSETNVGCIVSSTTLTRCSLNLITFYAASAEEAEQKATALDQGQRRDLFPAPAGLQFLSTRLPGQRRRLPLATELSNS